MGRYSARYLCVLPWLCGVWCIQVDYRADHHPQTWFLRLPSPSCIRGLVESPVWWPASAGAAAKATQQQLNNNYWHKYSASSNELNERGVVRTVAGPVCVCVSVCVHSISLLMCYPVTVTQGLKVQNKHIILLQHKAGSGSNLLMPFHSKLQRTV